MPKTNQEPMTPAAWSLVEKNLAVVEMVFSRYPALRHDHDEYAEIGLRALCRVAKWFRPEKVKTGKTIDQAFRNLAIPACLKDQVGAYRKAVQKSGLRLDHDNVSEPAAPGMDPLDTMIGDEAAAGLWALAERTLTPQEFTVLHLRLREELPFWKIAGRMQLTLPVIIPMFHAAVAKLKTAARVAPEARGAGDRGG